MIDYFLLKNFVDSQYLNGKGVDHEKIAAEFQNVVLRNMSTMDFEEQLIILGYIPDLYASDSSEETLYSKMVEVVLCEWAIRMGYEGKIIKQKSSYEDVNIIINSNTIVADAKSFRLGRSQKAPNVKDFVKPEDYYKWLTRHKSGKGGLVAYPCTHEWAVKSDAYRYCSSQRNPIIMLPYKYLAFILNSCEKKSIDITPLWDFSIVFPKEATTKNEYWEKMNKAIIGVIGTTEENLKSYIEKANELINKCVKANIALIKEEKEKSLINIRKEIDLITREEDLRQRFIDYRINKETEYLDTIIKRINDYRLN